MTIWDLFLFLIILPLFFPHFFKNFTSFSRLFFLPENESCCVYTYIGNRRAPTIRLKIYLCHIHIISHSFLDIDFFIFEYATTIENLVLFASTWEKCAHSTLLFLVVFWEIFQKWIENKKILNRWLAGWQKKNWNPNNKKKYKF